jgi:putrescine importer
VIRHFYLRLGRRKGAAFFSNLVFPLAGALVCSYVWMNLTGKAKLVGFAWLGLGLVYLAIVTRGFQTRPKQFELPSEL